jgi:vitamin B12 transporter
MPAARFPVRAAIGTLAAALAALPAAADTLLPETVVSAAREPLAGERVGSSVTVVTRRDLELRQGRQVVDILREVPGVAVSRSGSFGGQVDVRIRGAESRHTLVLVDGVKMNDAALGSTFDFAQLAADDIERIEILRGPQSSIYGSEAIGGVINIVTRRAARGLSANAFAEAGSFRTTSAGFAARYGDDLFKGTFAHTWFKTAGISSADKRNGNAEADGFRSNTMHGTATFTPVPYFELRFAGRYVHSRGGLDAFQDGFIIPCLASGVCIAVDDRSFYKAEHLFGKTDALLKLFEGRLVNRTGLAFGRIRNDSFGDAFAGLFENRSTRRKIDNETTLRFETPALLAAEHRLTFLFEHERQTVRSASAFGQFSRAIAARSYVGEYAGAFLDRVFVTGSVRFDDNDFFRDALTYRATFAYRHRETGTRLHASVGTGVKNPDLFQLFGQFPGFTPNPGLRPEKAFGWDVGVEQTLLDGRLVVDVTYFNNRITDLINATLTTATNIDGTTRLSGIEIAVKWRASDEIELGGAYTWTQALQANTHQPVRRARHIGSVFATWTSPDKRGTLHVNARFNGGQRDTIFLDNFTSRQTDLGAYVLVNVTGSFKITPNVEVYGRLENILNQKYQEVFSFGAPGFGAYAGLRVKFDWTP